jgi:hypothetical protein
MIGRRKARHHKPKHLRVKNASIEQKKEWSRQGGYVRAMLLSKEERIIIARQGAVARWKLNKQI